MVIITPMLKDDVRFRRVNTLLTRVPSTSSMLINYNIIILKIAYVSLCSLHIEWHIEDVQNCWVEI